MPYAVYILACADSTLYVGCTNNLVKRLREHNTSKNGAHYTKIRRPVVLKYSEELPNLHEARAREAALKRLTREKKLELFMKPEKRGKRQGKKEEKMEVKKKEKYKQAQSKRTKQK